MQIGLIFDLRNPSQPESDAQAIALVRYWARVKNVSIPDGIEATIVHHDRDPNDWRTYPTMYVGFEWGEDENG